MNWLSVELGVGDDGLAAIFDSSHPGDSDLVCHAGRMRSSHTALTPGSGSLRSAESCL